MRLASFTLNDTNQTGYGADAETALRTVAGVSDVLIGDVNDTCSVVYDENGTTASQLRDALGKAGYTSQLVELAPQGGGSCCGSCS
jgi:copper chaperone CopZ